MNRIVIDEKAYCAECGKHWSAEVVEDGICFMCSDMDEAESVSA